MGEINMKQGLFGHCVKIAVILHVLQPIGDKRWQFFYHLSVHNGKICEVCIYRDTSRETVPLKVVSNEMKGGSDVVSIKSYYSITQVLGLGLSFYWVVVF